MSSLHEDLHSLATSTEKPLPPALCLCGTEDALLDYTLLMGTKWMIAGEEAIVKSYLGAPHAFTTFAGLPVAFALCVISWRQWSKIHLSASGS